MFRSVHSVKPEPHNEIPQGQSAHNNFWDFQYMHPEATHMFMWAMSDRGIPRSYRMMQGFGVNTYVLVNKEGKRSFVKFHLIPELGVHSLVWDEALKLAGQDPDFHRKDLMEAIDNKAYPKWKFAIQTIPEDWEHDFEFDILDATKVWPEDLVPLRVIGELELNRNVDEFFPQTEQVAFCTSHIVPGIDFSDDPLLQGRNFSYFDTQISRLGINWEELPINRPVCPVMNHNRDGAMRHKITQGTVNYWPNRFDACPPTSTEDGGFTSSSAKVPSRKARTVSPKFREHINQAQLFYNSLSPYEQHHVCKALTFELDHCDDPTVYNRLVSRLTEIDLPLAQKVAMSVGATQTPEKEGRTNKGAKAPGLSQTDYVSENPTIKSRRIAILLADGYDSLAFSSMKAAILAVGALPLIIGTKRQPIFAEGESSDTSKGVTPDHFYDGQRSTMFDATFIPGGQKHIEALSKIGQMKHWVCETFGHLKTLGAVGEAVDFVSICLPNVKSSDGSKKLEFSGVSGSGGVTESYGVVTAGTVPKPETFREGVEIVRSASDFVGKFFYQISQHRNYEREMDGLADSIAF